MATDWDGWDLSYTGDIFGPLYMGGSVEQAMIRTLKLWLPSYIAEINRQLGATLLTVPKDYLYMPDERTIAAQTSQVIVTVPGTVGVPERHTGGPAGGGGTTRTTFDVRVSVFYGGTQNFNESRAAAQAYAAAVIGAVAQHPSLAPEGETFAELTKWTGYKAGVEGRSSTLWRTQTLVTFHVVLGNTLSPFGGPPAPSVAAPAEQVTVTAENVKVQQE